MEDITKNGCKIKWEKPEDDGGKPITGYQVEKLDKATGRWVPVGRTADTDMDIKGLQEGHEYQFRVKAINDEGESEPLESDRSIIAKNPYGLSLQVCPAIFRANYYFLSLIYIAAVNIYAYNFICNMFAYAISLCIAE